MDTNISAIHLAEIKRFVAIAVLPPKLLVLPYEVVETDNLFELQPIKRNAVH